MSRTYYEWLHARDAWRSEHNLRISSFPFPDRNSIVYERESNNTFWEIRRSDTAALIPHTTLSYAAEDTFNFIRSVA